MTEQGSRFTFATFVVGPANRLASAAARRAAENPGSHYHPLFIYSRPGLGKTHLLGAIGHRIRKLHPDMAVEYLGAKEFLVEVGAAPGKKALAKAQERYDGLDILLMDDVQFLAGQSEAQRVLLGSLNALEAEGKQIVLSCDRAPSLIEDLDPDLRTRFESGLVVDIGPPEFETCTAIVREALGARKDTLDPGVSQAVCGSGFSSVRGLLEVLDRILEAQAELGHPIKPEEVSAVLEGLGAEATDSGGTELGQFLDEISGSVAAKVEAQEAPWCTLLREAAEDAEEEGFGADELRKVMEESAPPGDVEGIVAGFKQTVLRLKTIKAELESLGNPWPEAAHTFLKDPGRLDEAEALLASALERARLFPEIPEGPDLQSLGREFPQLVVRAAEQLVATDRPEYNPLYVWSPDGEAARVLLEAAGRSRQETKDGALVALVSVQEFAEEFLQSLSRGVAGAWRERWWSVDLLLVHGAQLLAGTEGAQEEFSHLLDALLRKKARVMLAADRPPDEITGVDDRLESRLMGGLVLELGVLASHLPPALRAPSPEEPSVPGSPEGDPDVVAAVDREWIQSFSAGAVTPSEITGSGKPRKGEEGASRKEAARQIQSDGMREVEGLPSPERVVWNWPKLEDRIVEALD